MPGRKGFDYYEAFRNQAQYCEEIAQNLRGGIEAGELGSRALTNALHTVENDADQVNHQIQSHLLSDFVVPLERDGMGRGRTDRLLAGRQLRDGDGRRWLDGEMDHRPSR